MVLDFINFYCGIARFNVRNFSFKVARLGARLDFGRAGVGIYGFALPDNHFISANEKRAKRVR